MMLVHHNLNSSKGKNNHFYKDNIRFKTGPLLLKRFFTLSEDVFRLLKWVESRLEKKMSEKYNNEEKIQS